MKRIHLSLLTPLLATAMLSACAQPSNPASAAAGQPADGTIARAVDEAVTEARREIHEGNITLSNDGPGGAKAEITPQGDFLIDGRKVGVTPAQRALLLEHRSRVAAVAEAGMQVGLKGAELATIAMKEAARGLLSGDSTSVEAKVEAEAAKIQGSALQLCGHLPALLASQQKLAAALPEFKPYATMTQADVDDCKADVKKDMVAENAAAG
ncbi:hypothetical protein ACFFGH_15585 [Lysobacter korlensis]|uniref:DUF2884 family protein n=1 Tax=Lysobacter korlensis TaxID=553636 RepID=A0ABV6RS85_9GAMM